MSTNHVRGWDFDCDDDEDVEPAPRLPRSVRRKLHVRRIVGGPEGDEKQIFATCPLNGAPSLLACTQCPHFESFSLDPAGEDSYVKCANLGELPTWPIPLHAPARAAALRTPLRSFMRAPICVRAELTIERLRELLATSRIGGAPVVDAEGKLVGIVSKSDVVAAPAGATLVGEILSPQVVSLPESASLLDAIELLTEKHLHRAPVVAPSGHVVGVVSGTDITAWIATKPEPDSSWASANRATL